MRSVIRISIYFFLFVHCLALASAESNFHIIRPKFRSEAELLPVLQNMFMGKARFSTMNGSIIVSSDEKTWSAIEKLLADLDQKPRMLMVKLFFSKEGSETKNDASLGGVLKKAPVVARSGNTTKLQAQDMQRKSNAVGISKLLEGSSASLTASTAQHSYHFTVTPRLAGKSVVVKILQNNIQAQDVSSFQTEVQGSLGSKIFVASMPQESAQSSSGILSRSSGSSQSNITLYMQVTLAP